MNTNDAPLARSVNEFIQRITMLCLGLHFVDGQIKATPETPELKMRSYSTPMVLILLLCGLNARIWSTEPQLLFSPSVIEIKPTIDETNSSFNVKATNISQRVIEIKEFKGGCGCISFNSPVRTLEPGASTDVLVVFDFKDFIGPQNRSLSLLTQSVADPEPIKNTFLLKGEIPTALKFSKKAAIWLYGESATPKALSISTKDEYQITDLKVEDVKLNHFIEVQQTMAPDGRSLTITVTPSTTKIEDVSPTERANLQVPYVVKYKTQSGKERYERFWVLLAKRPEIKPDPNAAIQQPLVTPAPKESP